METVATESSLLAMPPSVPLQNTLSISAPIRKVVVFEDRAQIVREVRLELPAGAHRLTVLDITPLLVDHTLQVQVLEGQAALGDTRVVRIPVAERVEPLDIAALTTQREHLEAQVKALEDDRSRHTRHIELLERWLNDIRVRWEVGVARGLPADQFIEEIRRLMAQLDELLASRLALKTELAHVEEQLQEVTDKLSLAPQIKRTYTARLETRIELVEPGSVALAIRYVVPCALWRPEHLARIATGPEGSQLSFGTRAVIWQATLEDWQGVELSVSTARPGRIASPPTLQDDLLMARKKSDAERREIIAEVRDEEIQTTGLGSSTTVSSLPGVDDGGETLSWRVPHAVSIPAHGRPTRAPLFLWTTPAESSNVSLPERRPEVLVRAEQANTSAQPILAGPVILYRGQDYVGRSQVKFVAPGERFALSFGSLDGVRVQRDQRTERDINRLTGHQTLTLTVTLSLSNLSDRSIPIRMTERVPVSELEDVKINVSEKAPARPDKDGMLIWSETLGPRAHLTRELSFRIDAPSRVRLPF